MGWIYPFAARNDDEFIYHHAKQGFVTALFFTALPVLLTIAFFLSPPDIKIIGFSLTLTIYLSHILYFSLCIWGSVMMAKGVKGDFPGIDRVARKLNV